MELIFYSQIMMSIINSTTVKIKLKLIFFGLILFTSINVKAQIWPFSPMIRLGNVVYYDIDSLSKNNLTGTNKNFDKKLNNRYFDIISKNDSIEFLIKDSLVSFKQKLRSKPKCYKEIIFYNRRYLINSNTKIKYLRIIDISDTCIIAQATIKQKKNKPYSRKEVISIYKKDIEGVFVGPGKTMRTFEMGLIIGFGTIGLIIGL